MSHDHSNHAHTPHEADALDAWHTHAVDEKPMHAHGQKIDSLRVIIVGFAGYILTVATIVVIWVYFISYKDSLKITSEEFPERFENQASVQETQLAAREEALTKTLANTQPRWTDPQAGTVSISVDQAMSRVVEKYKK